MSRIIRVVLVGALVAGFCVAVPSADARRRPPPPIEITGCATPPISEAGRTYVMKHSIGPCVGDGLTVSAKNVTINLGGFDLKGDDTGGLDAGVKIAPSLTGVRIRNGTIRDFGRGIEAPTSTTGTVVSRVSVLSNGAFGMLLGPATVVDSIAAGNNGTGIDIKSTGGTGAGSIRSSLATQNTSFGFSMTDLATALVDRSTAVQNDNTGIFMASNASTVRRSTTNRNGDGIKMFGTKDAVDRVQASANLGNGIFIGATAETPRITRSTVTGNGEAPASTHEGILINTSNGAVVTSNRVNGNFGDGIKIEPTNPATVDGNTANGNGWGDPQGDNFGIRSSSGHGHNRATGNDADDNQCVDDILC